MSCYGLPYQLKTSLLYFQFGKQQNKGKKIRIHSLPPQMRLSGIRMVRFSNLRKRPLLTVLYGYTNQGTHLTINSQQLPDWVRIPLCPSSHCNLPAYSPIESKYVTQVLPRGYNPTCGLRPMPLHQKIKGKIMDGFTLDIIS